MKKIIPGFLASMALLTMSCGSVPQTYYYRIDYERNSDNSVNHVVPSVIGVSQFKADVSYEDDKIVYRDSPYEVQYYHYRRWVAPPKKIVTERVVQDYQASGVFERVVKLPSATVVDYILTGHVQAFEEWDERDTWYGVVTLEFELLDPSNLEVVWTKQFSEKTLVSEKEPVEVVRAISESLGKVIDKSIAEVRQALNTNSSM